MSKKMLIVGLAGALGVAALGTAANADSFRYQPQPLPPVTAPVQHYHQPAPLPFIPSPPVTQPTAYGQWTWTGHRYEWVSRQPTREELRGERMKRMEEARQAAEARRIEQQRIAEARRIEQQRRERERHERFHQAPDGTRVVYRNYK
jgi:hypothetical protein